ncbi:MAG: DUF4390 domain-containing protein [Burkholderiaceae bacterium]
MSALKALLAAALISLPGAARADAAVEVEPLRMARADDALALSAVLRFELPLAVDDALRKGIPMHFVYEADLIEPRWYWTDKVVSTAARTVRLAFQPLTRRWRINVYAGLPGAANPSQTFGQNFDTLDEALGAVRRVSGWRIAKWSDVEPGSRQRVELRFRLDVGQLPRPMQIGTAGEPDWRISASRSQRIALDGTP